MQKNDTPQGQGKLPFGQRNNFPDFDVAFRDGAKTSVSLCSNFSHRSLDMSIDARAALSEHLRHVAKHGVDGEQFKENDDPCSLQDRMWDNLLNTPKTRLSENQNFPFVANIATINGGQESVEVSFLNDCTFSTTDTNSDYFNSSKVQLLATPERNKNRNQVVLSRKEEQDYEEEEHASSFNQSASASSSVHNMAHIFRNAMQIDDSRITDTESSFSAYFGSTKESPTDARQLSAADMFSFTGAVDVSRISANDSICTPRRRGSPSRSLSSKEEERALLRGQKLSSKTGFLTSSQQKSSRYSSLTPPRPQSFTQCYFSPPKSLSCLSPVETQAASLAISQLSSTKREKTDPFPFSVASDRSHSPIRADLSAIEINSDHDYYDSTLLKEDRGRNKESENRSISKVATRVEDRRRYRTVVPSRVIFKDQDSTYEVRDDSFSIPLSHQLSSQQF